MQKRNIDDDEIILVEDKRDRFFLTQDHNGRKSIIKGGWIGDSQTQYMLIKQYFLQRNGNHVTQNFKTSMWKDYVFVWMSHPTHVILLSQQAKRYVIILIK